MCKFCRFTRWYFPAKHHELPPGTTVDAKITTRKVALPSEEDRDFVLDNLVTLLNRNAYRDIKKYSFESARLSLELASACQPSNNKIHALYALYYLHQEDLDKALDCIKTSLKLNNSDAESFLIASHIYVEQQNFEMAMRALEIGLACVPDTTENSESRKLISDMLADLKQTVQDPTASKPSTSTLPNSSTSPTKSNPKPDALFVPKVLTENPTIAIFAQLDFKSAKSMELVSKDWRQRALSTETKQAVTHSHTTALSQLISASIQIELFESAFRQWRQLEKNNVIRSKFNDYFLLSDDQSYSTLQPPADFFAPRFELGLEIMKKLPHDLLVLYSIHNGFTLYLRGAIKLTETYKCTLYPLDSPRFTIVPFYVNVPPPFREQVKVLDAYMIALGTIKMSAPRYDRKNTDIYDNRVNAEPQEEEHDKIHIVLDVNPNTKGTFGQILIVCGYDIVDILTGGISQLLEYLTCLDACNLIATIGVKNNDTSDSNLPSSMAHSVSKLNHTVKTKKLGSLLRKMKRYKSAYKGFQCRISN